MQLGLDVSQHQLSWDEIVGRARFAEEAGFDGVWVFDHFKALYADPHGPCLEGWTLLAGLAAATTRIRLGPLVTGITYRHPSILATEAVTVDHISGGRLELALGAAWHDGEHRELGIDFPRPAERARRLDEAIEVIDLLMTTDGASFEGKFFRLDRATYNPKPVQKPRPPLWIGAGGEKLMLPLVARRADVWHGFGNVASIKRKMAIIDAEAARAGRDPAAIRRATALSISQPWDEVMNAAESMAALGISYLTVSWPGEGRGRVEEFVTQLGADIRALN
ncbi:MAG: TIGR03560 family F420-dependent LLM class oxidoreductase [Actinomycetota bacterium]